MAKRTLKLGRYKQLISSNHLTIIKGLFKYTIPGSGGVTDELYRRFKWKITPIILIASHKIERYGTLPNMFYQASTILIPKSDKDIRQKYL